MSALLNLNLAKRRWASIDDSHLFLLSDDFHQDALSTSAIELAVKDLPSPGVRR